jgi:hypothetical protein
MTEPKPWGSYTLDAEISRDVVVVQPSATLREAALALIGLKDELAANPRPGEEQAREKNPRFFYLVVALGGGRYQVFRFDELERHLADLGEDVIDQSFEQVLQQRPWTAVEDFERGTIGQQAANTKRAAQGATPEERVNGGDRLVVLEGGKVIGVFAATMRSGERPSLDLLAAAQREPEVLGPEEPLTSTPPPDPGVLEGDGPPDQPKSPAAKPRSINTRVVGGRGTSKDNPMAVNKRYILRFGVDSGEEDAADLVFRGETIAQAELERFVTSPEQTHVDMTFALQVLDPAQLQVLGPEQQTIPVPVADAGGPSDYEALFQIKPLVAGDIPLLVYVEVKGQILQTIELTLAVAASERVAATSALPDEARVSVRGYSTGSIAALPTRSNPLNLIITPQPASYDLLLFAGSTLRARLPLTDTAVTQLIEQSRKVLKEGVVYLKQEGVFPYQRAIDIDAGLHQKTLAALASEGRALFNDLFFGPGAGEDARKMGETIESISRRSGALNITVVGQNFIFPWALIYDKPENEPVSIDGFWGFKHIIQHLPEAGSPDLAAFEPTIPAADGLKMSFVYNRDIDEEMKRPIIADQQAAFKQIAGLAIEEHEGEASLVKLLNNPANKAQFIYLYCHAVSYRPDEVDRQGIQKAVADSKLVLSKGGGISVRDLGKMANTRFRLGGAPLVYINACQSAELSPLIYQGLVPYFIAKGARGVLGTEVDTPALFAAEFAKRFFAEFVKGEQTLGELLLALRREFAEKHNNVTGLLYSLYSSGDIIVGKG